MKYAYEITAEDKREFLELIYAGNDFERAAKLLDSTGTQFRKHRSAKSQYFDKGFARDCEIAVRSEEHQQARLEHLRGLQWERAEAGSDRMIEKLSYAHDPDWEALRHQNLNVNLQMVARVLPYISREELDAAIAKAEADVELSPPDLKALPPPREDQAANLG